MPLIMPIFALNLFLRSLCLVSSKTLEAKFQIFNLLLLGSYVIWLNC